MSSSNNPSEWNGSFWVISRRLDPAGPLANAPIFQARQEPAGVLWRYADQVLTPSASPGGLHVTAGLSSLPFPQ